MFLQQRSVHGFNQEEEMYQFQGGYRSLSCLIQQNKFQEQVPKSMGKYFTLETLKSIRNMMNIKTNSLIMFYKNKSTRVLKVLVTFRYGLIDIYICPYYLCLHQENYQSRYFSGIGITDILVCA